MVALTRVAVVEGDGVERHIADVTDAAGDFKDNAKRLADLADRNVDHIPSAHTNIHLQLVVVYIRTHV